MKFSTLILVLSFGFSAFAISANNQRSTFHADNQATKQVPGTQVSCACDGKFLVGDRVRLIFDHPDSNPVLVSGHEGSVVSGTSGHPNLLISWDNFNEGHNGNGIATCPRTTLPDSSGWYVECEHVELVNPVTTGLGGCLNNIGNHQSGAREAVMSQPGVLTVVTPMDQNSCFNFAHPVAGKSYSITINGEL